ncbi:type II restriction endonuclease [Helicobacter pylori]|uniref:type IIG restriction enzyme/methyltransferase n=1 Tax=Helicobacter pylori TaxID=210 RepID=UPI000993BF61|nr:Eco57I restriction-modification methylase domain-containing protein [Helicobacter pylori]OOP90660.1 type II restriction endonuclease [Helicobacter pylori]PDW70432.1 type II restriction endonuclease [Helicobacter pylori]PDW71837.1 type II restriction endonuclease [Helicobacter pylori]
MMSFTRIPLKDFIKKYNPQTPTKETIENFEKEINSLLENAPRQDDEEFQKNEINKFLKNAYGYECNTRKKVDSAIYVDGEVQVLIEVKALNKKTEFPKDRENPLSKAFCQMVLYFLEEIEKEKNNSLKHTIICNAHEFFLFDCKDLLFLKDDKRIKKFYKNHAQKEGTDSSKPKFYKDLEQYLQKDFQGELRYTHFNLSSYDPKELPLIYQVLSQEVLLKQKKTLDANTLNKDFYEELLYILGLEEQNEKGKILIKPSRTKNSLSYALKEQYKNLNDEEVMALLIAWNNRILFLRLLESLLISFEHFKESFLTIENFNDFNALNTLFFEVLAKKNSERLKEIKEDKILEKIPYLNSSLFDKTPLELKGYEIKLLDNKKLEIYKNSVLKKDNPKQEPLPLLKYFFEFLRIYDFTTTPKDIKDNQNRSESRLINPSVLGLVFEKLNGYKEGSFYTPSFITSYMCKESITTIVLDKFNQTYYKIECDKLKELKNYLKNSYKEDKRKKYLQLLLTLRVCDPAVGSGHFLVSALNEMVWIAYELGLIASLHRYDLKLENDEIIIHYTPTGEIFNYKKPDSENDPHHQIQKELFNLKKDIIENCLFGVDINPNSCEITKLRLWIELLKYSYYIFEEGKNTNNLETLPNIDINIKCANSLISRFDLNDDLKKIPNIKQKIQEYKDLVAQYKDPNPLYPLNKSDLINKIQDLKNTFSLTLKDPKTKAELEKAIEKHITKYNDFALDDKSLLTGLNYFIPSLFGTPKLSPKEEEEAFASYGRIRALRKKLDDALSGREYHNAFEWRFEFPEVLDNEGNFLGFDCIIGNPPYMQVKKGLYSSIFYPFSEGKDIGKQNTYKVFIELGFNLTKQKGLISLITQSSIMCDCSAQFTRELLLKYCQIHYFVEFNKKQKLFSNVIQGVCILEFLKDRPSKEHAFKIAINNTQIQMNQIQYEQIKQDEILKFFPLYEIPLIKSGEMEIVRKIKTDKILLRDLLEKSLQGNINTIHLKDIQDQKETNGRIYKGANCHRYFLDTQYLFAKDNQVTQQIFEKNYYQNIIVTQNITGTSDAYRIHANLIEVKNQEMLFLDTCNLSYCKEREHAKFLVGLLNSRLLDWLFRKTSTNNHVNLYELETLPIPQITKSNKPTADKITNGAKQILALKEKDPKANTQKLEKEIDALVYQLYNLTDEEIKIIENGQ